MRTRRGRALAGLATVVASTAVAGGVVAATQSSDEAALAPSRQCRRAAASRSGSTRLLAKMTIDEKLQQIQLLSDGQINDADARSGVGGVFSLVRPGDDQPLPARWRSRSRACASRSCSPTTRSTASGRSSRSRSARRAASIPASRPHDHKIGARESAAVGLKQIYSPMVDVSHEPRWGRISEAGGEDPYLNSVFAAARVKARAGQRLQRARQGRHERQALRRLRPARGRPRLQHDRHVRAAAAQPLPAAVQGRDRRRRGHRDVLVQRDQRRPGLRQPASSRPTCSSSEWGFDGFIESDYTAVAELRACPPKIPTTGSCGHGVAADGPDAAALALNAGTDSEMVSTNIRDYGKQLLAQGRISMARIDDAVRRILRVKFRAGLFEHPYVDPAKAESGAAAARRRRGRAQGGGPLDGAAQERRRAATLPLSTDEEDRGDRPAGDRPARHARPVVGPRASTRTPSPSSTASRRRARDDDVTPRAARSPTRSRRTTRRRTSAAPTPASTRRSPPREAADQVVLALGESRGQSGEAASRSEIDLPGQQEELIAAHQGDRQAVRGRAVQRPAADARAASSTTRRRSSRRGSPASRPATRSPTSLFGKVNPGGKLPVSFPRRVGQVPIYYNHEPTGRPCDADVEVQLALPRHPELRPAVRVRLRPQLQQVRDLEPAAERVEGVLAREAHGLGRRDRTSRDRRATRWCSSTSTTRWRASPSRSAGCAGSSA